ncbi:unnamed protein product (macronuclear) [Paramecium tetraurelia]|uniref:SP-RING-type domain-containing protein n=1 Tax=Paramecium tetraurelia TaxID=5888 RepID=A0DL03_PARTE|nr:uncharacterized protein GSPATT00018037001 [Paramecium tetraurelia]CAK83720.1 unnamed protein product [Paramecium tetraurelia]|eukprot:XP_001451117.1 hypothetical protein (macronuclear) [Paramecium tetraurelia strain d4-2]
MIQKQIFNPPKSISDLFLGSYFNLDDVPKINRHPILKKIIDHINQRINHFFQHQISTLKFLIDQQKLIDSSSTRSSPIVIDIEIDSNQKIQEEQQEKVLTQESELIQLAQYQHPTQEQLNCPYCVCKKSNQTVLKSLALRCAVCKNYFHSSCLRIEKPKKVFVCPECILIGIDPLHELKESILDPVIFQSVEGRANQFTQKFQMKKGIPSEQLIELRSIKIDGQYEDISWPDLGDLQLNGKKIQEFRPLANNSCLKKRKDEKLMLNIELGQVNLLTIRESNGTPEMKAYRINQGIPYMLGIFQVKVYKLSEFIKKVKMDQSCLLGIEQSKKFIQLSILQNQFDEVTMESIKVSLDCVYDLNQIQTPARGNICEHIQCFSLENLVTMMKNVTPRKWKCPICKQMILGLQVDAYQMCILTIIKHLQAECLILQGEVENPELRELLKQQETTLPDSTRSNNNRVIQLEQISQRILKISNQVVAEPKNKYKPPPPLPEPKPIKKIGESFSDAILID